MKESVNKKLELYRKLYNMIFASMFESGHFCNVLIRVMEMCVCGRGIIRDAVIKEIKLLSVLLQYDCCAKGKN